MFAHILLGALSQSAQSVLQYETLHFPCTAQCNSLQLDLATLQPDLATLQCRKPCCSASQHVETPRTTLQHRYRSALSHYARSVTMRSDGMDVSSAVSVRWALRRAAGALSRGSAASRALGRAGVCAVASLAVAHFARMRQAACPRGTSAAATVARATLPRAGRHVALVGHTLLVE
jgi:hypothetical protein